MWVFPQRGWFPGFSFAEGKRCCSEHWIFFPGMWFLRRHTVYFSSGLHWFCQILIVNTTSKAWFTVKGGQGGTRGTLSALGLGAGSRSHTGRTSGTADTVWGHRGVCVWAPVAAWVGTLLKPRLMGSSSNCFILSSFFLCVGSCVEEGALAAVSQDGFQSRPVWISFRHLFQGYVACWESRGLRFHFPGSWWASVSYSIYLGQGGK